MPYLRIAILDVGHGDFIYAETPLGDRLVIDVGSGDVIPAKFLSKISTLSELTITHPHTDHFDDIIDFSKKKVNSFRCPDLTHFADATIGWKKSDKEKIKCLRNLKATNSSDNNAVKVGQGFSHTVWYPSNIDYNDPNTSSVITTLSYGGTKILFGGDLPDSGWQDLLKKPGFISAIKGTTVFKVPHHGRKEGCSEALFKYISPKLCVISDKPLSKDNQNTVATSWYSQRTLGCTIVGQKEKRKVLSTRSDKSIFIKINEEGTFWVYPDTCWRTD